MGIIKNLFGQKPPSWATLSRGEWGLFVGQLREELSKGGESWTEDLEQGVIVFESGRNMGLFNLVRIWKRAETPNRPAEIAKFIQCLDAINDREDPETWEQAKPHLRVRINTSDWVGDLLPSIVARPICEGIAEYLMLDSETAATTVRKELLEKWAVSADEALEAGCQNVFDQEPCDVDRIPSPEGETMTVIYGDSIYTVAHALNLDRFIVPESPNGVLTILPDRRSILFVSVEKAALASILPDMINLGIKLYNEADGPILPSLYWYRSGQWTIVGRMGKDGYEITVPEELKPLFS